MLFKYKAITKEGTEKEGVIDALNIDIATSSLQGRGLIVSLIEPKDKPNFFRKIPFFNRVKIKEVVIVSRQMATLFEAQVSALRVFRLLSSETDNATLKQSLSEIAHSLLTTKIFFFVLCLVIALYLNNIIVRILEELEVLEELGLVLF